jgi:predicted DNA-binding transcriptional regulator AlpA
MAQSCSPTLGRSTEQDVVAAQPAVLLGIKAVADLLDCSVRHVHRLRDGGKMPQPVRLGSLVKWRRMEIEQWVASGCPNCRRSRQ